MKESLLRFNNKQKYLVFDYETCGLNLMSKDNKPWQLAFLLVQGDKVIDEADYILSWPNINVSKDAARITGFSLAKYNKRKSCPLVALAHFEKYLYDEEILVVGHNILGFDLYIHNIHRKLCNKGSDYSYIESVLDTVCLGRAIKANIKRQKGTDLLSWQYRLLNHRQKGLKVTLKQCCKDYNIDYDPEKLHDALYDIKKNNEIFKKMLWEVEV
jgi:DNA polymerase III alpha subunit (gram-positive type)